jgi:hypothetical protein
MPAKARGRFQRQEREAATSASDRYELITRNGRTSGGHERKPPPKRDAGGGFRCFESDEFTKRRSDVAEITLPAVAVAYAAISRGAGSSSGPRRTDRGYASRWSHAIEALTTCQGSEPRAQSCLPRPPGWRLDIRRGQRSRGNQAGTLQKPVWLPDVPMGSHLPRKRGILGNVRARSVALSRRKPGFESR